MINAKHLISEARARTGLEDLGDPSFQEPMERVLESVNRESRFSEIGAVAFREMIIKALTNRLEVEDWYRRYPEIDEEEIVAPVFGVGFSRSGSSFLSSLMALDPETRSLRTWESPNPCPPPIQGEIDEARLIAAEQRMSLFKERYPALFAMIPMGVHEPTECFEILMNAFCCDYYFQYADCQEFLDWFYDPARDYSFGYRYHKRILKLLQWRCPPKRWALKMPSHSLMVKGLFDVYPDARFIMTHREPTKVMPSLAKMVAVMREDFLVDAQTDRFSNVMVALLEQRMRRLLDFRSAHETLFIDIYHAVLLARPKEEIARLYGWLGWPLKPSLVAIMDAWCAANPKVAYESKAGSNLDFGDIQRRFKFYTDRFYPNVGQNKA